MRCGLNLLYLIPGIVGGTEIYAAGLLAGLAQIDSENEYFVFVNRESVAWHLPSAPNFRRVVCPVRATNRAKRYFFEQVYLPGLLKHFHVDIVHSLGYVAPLFPPCPSVVTVHDLNFRAFGSRMQLAKQWALEFFVKQSARRAHHVITVSEFSRGQILSVLGISQEKVSVTLEATSSANPDLVDWAITLQRYGVNKPYIIAFSSSSPNKNIPRLIQAFVQARQNYSLPHQLVVVGHRHPDYVPDELNPIVFTGYLDVSSKQALLAGAEMLVFPSTYEGFGFPVLEAQQVGVPVVCSTAASLPEVVGEAAVFFDPFSVNEMAEAIGQVAQDKGLRESLKQKGLHNVSRFSWEKTARETLQIYYSVVNHSTFVGSLVR